jgi:hypothetical protein
MENTFDIASFDKDRTGAPASFRSMSRRLGISSLRKENL